MKIGQVVTFHYGPGAKPVNGNRSCPAIVVSVHSQDLVNLRLIEDNENGALSRVTSVGPAEIEGEFISRGFTV